MTRTQLTLYRFADRGFDEGVAGHISVRDPILTDHFWLNPLSQHFSQICVSDLILVNEHGDVVIGDEPINAAAFAIHSESKTSSIEFLACILAYSSQSIKKDLTFMLVSLTFSA